MPLFVKEDQEETAVFTAAWLREIDNLVNRTNQDSITFVIKVRDEN